MSTDIIRGPSNSPSEVQRNAAPSSKPKGALAAMAVGYFGVLATAFGGASRWWIVGFATVGLGAYVFTMTPYPAYRAFRHYATHWHTWVGHSISVMGGFFYARVYYGLRDDPFPEVIPENVQELLGSKGFRCEIRRPWHFKRYRCDAPRARRDTSYIDAMLPQELTRSEGMRITLLGGPYIVRWKNDSQWRAIARCYIGFDREGYHLHFVQRNYYRWMTWKNKIYNPELWERT